MLFKLIYSSIFKFVRIFSGTPCLFPKSVMIDKILSSKTNQGVFNVSSGVGYSIKDVLKCISNYLGKPISEIKEVEIGSDDVKEVILDSAMTEKNFNWKPKVDFVSTIEKQLDWYEKNGVNLKKSHLARPD